MKSSKKIVIFGVFDGLHSGHQKFLEQVATISDKIHVIVARDSVVERLKNKKTKYNETKRLAFLNEHKLITKTFLGDEIEGEYLVLKNIKPDLICLGYDQQALYQDLKTRVDQEELPLMKLIILEAHEPDTYHSTLLN